MWSVAMDLDTLYKLWNRLGTVAITGNGNTRTRFLDFKRGTHREEIWHWFESQHSRFCCGEVMQGARHVPITAGHGYWPVYDRNGMQICFGDRLEIQLCSSDGNTRPIRFEIENIHEPQGRLGCVEDVIALQLRTTSCGQQQLWADHWAQIIEPALALNRQQRAVEAKIMLGFRDHLGMTMRVRTVHRRIQEKWEQVLLNSPATVQVLETEQCDLQQWTQYLCLSYWRVGLLEEHPQLSRQAEYWIQGISYTQNGQLYGRSD